MKLEREELAEEARSFVAEIVKNAGLDLEVTTEGGGEHIQINLDGPDRGIVLSDSARLLYSINHLVNQVFFRRSVDGTNFVLDCDNYRSERTIELELMAEKAAEKVSGSGMRVAMQPMPSSERRVIHMALADQPNVRTESEGSGRRRRVLILPA